MSKSTKWLERLKANRRVRGEIRYREFYSTHLQGTDHRLRDMLYVLDVLDVKAGPLLTFIGLVLTSFSAFSALGGFSSTVVPDYILSALMFSVAGTLSIAAFYALSCVYVIGPNTKLFQKYIDFADGMAEEERADAILVLMANAASKRRIRYLIAFRFAFVALTLFFILIGVTGISHFNF